MLSLLLLSVALAADPCGSDALAEGLARARARWVALDLEGFQAQVTQVDATLRCLTVPIPRSQVAALHEVQALAAWARRDEPSVEAALRSLLVTSPGWRPGADLAPEGSGFHGAWQRSVQAGKGPNHLLEGPLWIDGLQAYTVPSERASFVQVLSDGAPPQSWYLWGGALPDPVLAASVPASSSSPAVEEGRGGSARTWLLSASVGSAVAAVVSFRLAEAQYQAFWEEETPTQARALWESNRRYNLLGVGLGVVASGCAVGAVFSGTW